MHPPPRPFLLPIRQPLHRTFSTTTTPLARSSRTALAHSHQSIPPYPHGPNLHYKQSNFGLYGTSKPQFGNKVSERNEIKTRRKWTPNIHEKRLWSVALNKYVRVKVQARVLRTIDKVGGLDEYLLGESVGRVKELGMEGWKMRWRLLQVPSVRDRIRQRRIALGLRPGGVEMWMRDEDLLPKAETKEHEGSEALQDGERGDEYSGKGGEGDGWQNIDEWVRKNRPEEYQKMQRDHPDLVQQTQPGGPSINP